MFTLNYILGTEAVKVFDEDDFENFKKYLEEEAIDCLREKQFETEIEMKQFIEGLSEAGYENYSIISETEYKELSEL